MLASIRLLHSMRDDRLSAQTSLLAMTLRDYLALTHGAEDNLDIQRRALGTNKIYERLQKDVVLGGTLPPIVLAISDDVELAEDLSGAPLPEALQALTPASVYIVDGLQRTHHLRLAAQQLHEPARSAFLARELRVEIWTRIRFAAVLYRMMLLNAAQTPMTLRHQLEVVSANLIRLVKTTAPEIALFTEKSKKRRVQALQFKASDLVEAFTAFLKRTAFIDAKSLVVDELDREDFLEHFEAKRSEQDIRVFLRFLADLDRVICNAYPGDIEPERDDEDGGRGVLRGTAFLGTKPYLLGVAAATGHVSSRLGEREFSRETSRLIRRLETQSDDPLGLTTFNMLLPDLLKSSGKIGDTQRDFVFHAFRQMLGDVEGSTPIAQHWVQAARRI